MVHFFWASFGQSFDLPGSERVFGISQNPFCVRMCLPAKMGSNKEVCDITYCEVAPSSVFDLQGFCVCAVERVFLTSVMRNLWSFIWTVPNLLCNTAFMEFLSTGE